MLATTLGATLVASPASAAGCTSCTYYRDATCSVGINPYYVRNRTFFRVSSAGRVHVDRIQINAWDNATHINPPRVDWDLRIKSTNAKLADGSAVAWSINARPSNGETIQGLKTTARLWYYNQYCLATVASY